MKERAEAAGAAKARATPSGKVERHGEASQVVEVLDRRSASWRTSVGLSAPLNRWTSRPEQRREGIMQNGPRASRCLTARTMECTNVTREGKEHREREWARGEENLVLIVFLT